MSFWEIFANRDFWMCITFILAIGLGIAFIVMHVQMKNHQKDLTRFDEDKKELLKEAEKEKKELLKESEKEKKVLTKEFEGEKKDLLLENERLRQLSITEEMTGIYNRRHFMHMLRMETARALRNKHNFFVIFIDLDKFKEYNDGPGGHLFGDNLLKSFAKLFDLSFRKGDTRARIGGDEFAAITPETSEDAVRKIILRIMESALRLDVRGEKVHLELSAGIYEFDGANLHHLKDFEIGIDAENILDMADQAMYTAKKIERIGGALQDKIITIK